MPSGPRGFPLIGNYLAYSRDALGFLERTWREHGDLSRFPLGPYDTWLVIHPDHVATWDHRKMV